jgi:chromosomal replication initiation ATPase DnaA
MNQTQRMIEVRDAVAAAFAVRGPDLTGSRRPEPLATARHVAIYLMHLEGHHYRAIEAFMNRKTSLVWYASHSIRERIPLEAALHAKFEQLCKTLSINPGDSGVNKP